MSEIDPNRRALRCELYAYELHGLIDHLNEGEARELYSKLQPLTVRLEARINDRQVCARAGYESAPRVTLPEEVRPKHNDSFSPPRIAGLGRPRLRSALVAIAPNASPYSIEELADAIMASRATFMRLEEEGSHVGAAERDSGFHHDSCSKVAKQIAEAEERGRGEAFGVLHALRDALPTISGGIRHHAFKAREAFAEVERTLCHYDTRAAERAKGGGHG